MSQNAAADCSNFFFSSSPKFFHFSEASLFFWGWLRPWQASVTLELILTVKTVKTYICVYIFYIYMHIDIGPS